MMESNRFSIMEAIAAKKIKYEFALLLNLLKEHLFYLSI